jgi:hypothetical protein
MKVLPLQKEDRWSLPFSLGRVPPDATDRFRKGVFALWLELTDCTGELSTPSQAFIARAAERLRQPEQPLMNAIDVIRAIIFQTPDGRVTIDSFAKFMAMFGPERTMMIKIASLLSSSEKTGQWLMLAPIDRLQPPHFFGAFDEREPNCLLLKRCDRPAVRVWNLPLTEAGEPYVTDESGRTYKDWEVYLRANPPTVDFYSYP